MQLSVCKRRVGALCTLFLAAWVVVIHVNASMCCNLLFIARLLCLTGDTASDTVRLQDISVSVSYAHLSCVCMVVLSLQEVSEAVVWILKELPTAIETRPSISLFETTIRVVGGLISSAHLKNDHDSRPLAKIAVELAGTQRLCGSCLYLCPEPVVQLNSESSTVLGWYASYCSLTPRDRNHTWQRTSSYHRAS